jgi:hypothetical protein
MVTLSDTGDL